MLLKSDAFETVEGVVLIDLPLTMTIERDLSALNSRPAQVRAVMHRESKVWAPETLADIRLRSSMKARSKGNVVLVVVNLGSLAYIEYSIMMFIPAKKGIIESVSQQKFPVDVYAKHWLLIQKMIY